MPPPPKERADRESNSLGLTMDELQSVGAEAGLDPAHVAAAARAVASGEPDDGRETLVGLPVGVRRAATLEVPPSDAMWEHLVADLQDTFAARGKTERIGAARIWRNGNLRLTLSPFADGARLRFQTNRRDDTRGLLIGSAINAALSVFFAVTPAGSANTPWILAAVAAGLLVLAVVRQFAWTRARERQMDAVVARAQRSAPTFGGTASDGATESAGSVVGDASAPRLGLVDLDAPNASGGTSSRRVRS